MCQSMPRFGKAGDLGVVGGRRGGHEAAGDPADAGDQQHRDRGELGMVAAVGALEDEQPAEQGAAEDGDIGAGFDQAGAAEHFVALEVLRQDRIFDRAEERRVNPHRRQRGEQQRDVVEQKAGRPEQHDPDLGGFDDADDARLVMRVGELPGERRKQEEGGDEQAAGDGAERRFLLGVAIDAEDHQHHHRGAEQIVVEGAQELGDEDRQEAPGLHEVDSVVHQAARRQVSKIIAAV